MALLHTIDLRTGRITNLVEIEAVNGREPFVHAATFSRDGAEVWYQVNTEIRWYSVATRASESHASWEEFRTGPNPSAVTATFSADRRRFMYFAAGSVNVCDETRRVIWSLPLEYYPAVREPLVFAFSPSGRFVAIYFRSRQLSDEGGWTVSDTTNEVRIWDVDANRQIAAIDAGQFHLSHVAFSPSDRELKFHRWPASQGPGFFDIETGRLDRYSRDATTTDGWSSGPYHSRYSADGRHLLCNGSLHDPQTLERVTLPTTQISLQALCDDTRLVPVRTHVEPGAARVADIEQISGELCAVQERHLALRASSQAQRAL